MNIRAVTHFKLLLDTPARSPERLSRIGQADQRDTFLQANCHKFLFYLDAYAKIQEYEI